MLITYRPEKINKILKRRDLSEREALICLSGKLPSAKKMVEFLRVLDFTDKDGIREALANIDPKIKKFGDVLKFLSQEEEKILLKIEENGLNSLTVASIMRCMNLDAVELAERLNEKSYTQSLESERKELSYFYDVTKKEDFISEVKRIRQKYGMPLGGFDDDEKWWGNNSGFAEEELYIKQDLLPILNKYSFGESWTEIAVNFVFFDEVYENCVPTTSLCLAIDEKELVDASYEEIDREDIDKTHPISIRVSPYASRNDIEDYVDKMYASRILRLQLKHRSETIRTVKTRKRKDLNMRRDALIVKVRDSGLSYSETLKKIPRDLKKNIDYGSVGKIISEERKKRKRE